MSPGISAGLPHIESWIFDLDNTLYPAECGLFMQVDERIGAFIANFLKIDRIAARRIQKKYFMDYGTTLNGLMEVHGLAPQTYLEYVHDIDHSPIKPDPALRTALNNLPGEKIIFTNGSISHAERVLQRLGVGDVFSSIHDISSGDYIPKPRRKSYESLIAQTGIAPQSSIMFEDIARNLSVPHEMGMQTVLVQPGGAHPDSELGLQGTGDEPYIDHFTRDLAGFLGKLEEPL